MGSQTWELWRPAIIPSYTEYVKTKQQRETQQAVLERGLGMWSKCTYELTVCIRHSSSPANPKGATRRSMLCSMFSENKYQQEYIIKEKRVSNFAIANVECMRKVTWHPVRYTWSTPNKLSVNMSVYYSTRVSLLRALDRKSKRLAVVAMASMSSKIVYLTLSLGLVLLASNLLYVSRSSIQVPRLLNLEVLVKLALCLRTSGVWEAQRPSQTI